MFMTTAEGKRRRKYEERFLTGMYVGLVNRSDELVVLTPTGAFKVNVIRRLPVEQRGDARFALSCQGLPWRMTPSDDPDRAILEPPTYMATEPIVPDSADKHAHRVCQGIVVHL